MIAKPLEYSVIKIRLKNRRIAFTTTKITIMKKLPYKKTYITPFQGIRKRFYLAFQVIFSKKTAIYFVKKDNSTQSFTINIDIHEHLVHCHNLASLSSEIVRNESKIDSIVNQILNEA